MTFYNEKDVKINIFAVERDEQLQAQQYIRPTATLEEIESKYDLRFDTLVADCEGFLEVFMDENPVLYDQLTMILFEKDCPHKCNYDKIIATLRAKGFRQLVAGFHEVWEREV